MATSIKRKEVQYIVVAVIALLLLFLFRLSVINSAIHIPNSSYLFIHTLLELFSVFVSLSIFVQARVTFSVHPTYFFLGLVFLVVGCFDLFHTLTYKGMPYHNDDFSVARATWFWISARATESIGVALFILKPNKLVGKNTKIGIALALLFLCICSSIIYFAPQRLPILFIEGTGITSLKITLEYIITIINLTTFIVLFRIYQKKPDIDSLRFLFGIFLIMVGELFFTLYRQVYDIENLIGHVFKAGGYLYLYRSVFYPHILQIISSKEAADNKREEAEKKLNEIEKNMSRQIFEAHEEERKRVSRELHDGIGQSLYSILITLNTLQREKSEDKREPIFSTIRMITENAMKEVKEIAHSLRPSSLDDLGFVPTLRSYLESYQQIHQIPVKFEITGVVGRLESEIETALYRICQEALTNSAKYAEPSQIEVKIEVDNDEVRLDISDNGKGFAVEDYLRNSARKGIGLFSIRERAEGLGGSANIDSYINEGTTITVHIPRA